MTTGIVPSRSWPPDCGRPSRQDQVHLQADQLRRKAREPFVAAIGRPVLDDEDFPLDVSKCPQTLPEGINVGGIDVGDVLSSMPMR